MTTTQLTTKVLITPPDLGLAQLRINGFSALKRTEQLQAAALALRRDFSVEPANLRLAVATSSQSQGIALVAFSMTPATGSSSELATDLLAAMVPGKAFWVNAPAGYIVGERGAATVDFAASQDELPAVVTGTLSALDPAKPMQCVLVNRDRSLISDERMRWWAAASGAEMVDGALPVSVPVALVSPPLARVAQQTTWLDRALTFTALAAVVCVALAGVQYANAPSPSATSLVGPARSSQATAGALLDRIGIVAPAVVAQTQSATYASGAWVLTLPDAMDADTLKRAVFALQANGLSVQSSAMPGPRIRVQLP